MERAAAIGLGTLAITDHDTFRAHEAAALRGQELGVRLVRGVEISTRANRRGVHLLAYWFHSAPPAEFAAWLEAMLVHRLERNRKLTARLREMGLEIELEEAEAIGRTITGRVHIARVLVRKGYVQSISEAFDRYIGEAAPGFVEMEEPQTVEAVKMVRKHGGVPVLAHPVRLKMKSERHVEEFVKELAAAGLLGLEVMHSDQDEDLQRHYLAMAERYGLAPSGGSDYHGSLNPRISLGTGVGGNVRVPEEWLRRLESL
jgi:predicted metal-dependent phosphoesterase TrpH